MKLLENNESLEQVKDVILNPEEAIDPGDMIVAELTPDVPNETDKQILQESKKSDASLIQYLKTENNPSYEGYKESQYFDPAIKTVYLFNMYVKKLYANGFVNKQSADAAVSNSLKRCKSSGSIGKVSTKQDDSYERPTEGSVKVKYLNDLQKKYQMDVLDINSRGTADEMYDNMRNVVHDILTQESTIRHALIYGDPGIGKCLCGETEITIQTDDDTADELLKFCAAQR